MCHNCVPAKPYVYKDPVWRKPWTAYQYGGFGEKSFYTWREAFDYAYKEAQ